MGKRDSLQAAPATRQQIAGKATVEGTARYARRHGQRFAADFYRSLADGSLAASIGIGTYLGQPDDDDDHAYEETVSRSLASGVNLIDSAINYRFQRSERAVGRAIRAAIDRGDAARDEMFVCTKGGYIPLDGTPPGSREEYNHYLEREYFATGLLMPEDVVAGGHSIAPAFLADQIARSLSNLRLDAIDLYYVHNPEQQLDVIPHPLFRERLLAAFRLLEEQVAAGRIGGYGCATWAGLRVPPGNRNHIDLAEIVEIATEAGGGSHHMCAVQLPINLGMAEAVRAPTQRLGSRTVPLLQAAMELGISVVSSATLMQARLADGLPAQLGETFPGLATDAQRAIAFVRSLPGVTTALVGMKRIPHLAENLGAAPPA
ncbi:MAG TPA: aldo/keto reductase [Gemmatimonadaceae bacterium]|nr:aldo/keto reductase [Gemmatimonadaceae bacterium]